MFGIRFLYAEEEESKFDRPFLFTIFFYSKLCYQFRGEFVINMFLAFFAGSICHFLFNLCVTHISNGLQNNGNGRFNDLRALCRSYYDMLRKYSPDMIDPKGRSLLMFAIIHPLLPTRGNAIVRAKRDTSSLLKS